jgi:predicted DNA-binding transcriptional regulator AlpA
MIPQNKHDVWRSTLSKTKLFDCPYYIAPHAVDRFRERVKSALPTRMIREIINNGLNCGEKRLLGYTRWNGQVTPLYSIQYEDLEFLAPISVDAQKTDGWPVVPTILTKNTGNIHWERKNGPEKWFKTLWESGMKKTLMAKCLGVSLSTITRRVKEYHLRPRRIGHKSTKWTDAEESAIMELTRDCRGSREIMSYFARHYPERPRPTVRVKIHRLKKTPKIL